MAAQYSYVSLLNKHQNLSDHERENLVLNQIMERKMVVWMQVIQGV